MNIFERRKGAFFTFDALVAISLLLIAFAYVASAPVQKTFQQSEYQRMHYAADDAIQTFSNTPFSSVNETLRNEIAALPKLAGEDIMNKSVIEVIGLIWSLYNETEYERNYSANLTRDFFGPLLAGMNYSLKIGDYRSTSPTVIYSSAGTPQAKKQQTSAFRIISGYKENSPHTGFVARAYVTGAAKKTQSYAYFGGFEGNGNITKILELPSVMDAIQETYIEMDAASNFTIFVNGIYSGRYNVSGNQPLRAKNWTMPQAYLSGFSPGQNNITIAFEDINTAYVGGGFIRVKYNTTQMDTAETKINADGNATEKYMFPGIDGLINIYSSFYVPGMLKSLGVQLHYLSEYDVFLNIGNISVYSNHSNESAYVYLNDTYLKSLLDYSLFNQTTPVRFGTSAVSGLNDGSDAVLITDVSGSMGWWMANDNTDGEARNCTDALFSAPNTSRISVAKCADKEFAENILGTPGQKMGLVNYSTITMGTVPLSDNSTLLTSLIDSYYDYSSTCITCGIRSATDMLASTINVTIRIANKSQWYYNDSFSLSAPPDDSMGRNWTHVNYSLEELWSAGEAPLGNASRLLTTKILQTAGTDNLADAYVSSNNPNNNYGSSSQLLVYSDGSKRSYLKFNIASLPGNRTINRSALYLYESASSVGDNISVFHVNDTAWAGRTESTITWNTQPCGTGFDNANNCNLTAESKVLVNTQNRWYEWNVTQMVNRSYTEGDLNVSMVLNISGSAGGKTESFRSKEYASDPARRPYLSIVYEEGTFINTVSDSIYFRKKFNISNISAVGKGLLSMMSDDYAEVYLNGALIINDSQPAHNATYWNSVTIVNRKYFRQGENVVTVRLNNRINTSRFDLELKTLNESRNKAMLVMSDGVITAGQSPYYLVSLTSSGIANSSFSANERHAINSSCYAYENYGIISHAVAFSAAADNATLRAIAECGHGNFYSSSNADELMQIYKDIANSIVAYSTQTAEISGETPTARLYTDSFIEYNYTPYINNTYGNISLTLESETFGNSSGNYSVESPKNGSYNITEKMAVIDVKATSYSSDYWTGVLETNSTTGQWTAAFNLSTFGNSYLSLGDPFIVNVPVSEVKAGEMNYVRINTANNATSFHGGSPDNRIIYTIKINGSVGYGNTFTTLENATEDAKRRLNESLMALGITATNINTGSQNVGKIPWMWGPAVITLEVWK